MRDPTNGKKLGNKAVTISFASNEIQKISDSNGKITLNSCSDGIKDLTEGTLHIRGYEKTKLSLSQLDRNQDIEIQPNKASSKYAFLKMVN